MSTLPLTMVHHQSPTLVLLAIAFKLVKALSLGKIVGSLVIGVKFGDLGKTLVDILQKEMQLHIQPFRAV